ncbi:hypothetical protein ACFL0L_00805 [Patescibacteria group bacterium]
MKHLPGFVPVQFRVVGVILLVIGIILLALLGVDYVAEWDLFPNEILYVGIGLLIIGLYIRLAAQKEKV